MGFETYNINYMIINLYRQTNIPIGLFSLFKDQKKLIN